MAGKQDEFRFFSDDWGRPSPKQRAINRSVVGDVLYAMFPSTVEATAAADAEAAEAYNKGDTARALGTSFRKVVTAPAGLVNDLVVNPFARLDAAESRVAGGILPFFAGLTGFGSGSGGELPPGAKTAPSATKQAALPPKAAAPAQPKAAATQAAAPMSPLERILTNMAKADPNGGISLGALRKLGSVFPGTPPTTKHPSMADVAGYQAMQLENMIYEDSLNRSRNAKSKAEADEIYTKAIERQINFNKALAGVKNSDEAMAKLFK